MGGAGLASALVAGRFSSQGRERQLIIGGILIGTVATAMLPFANNLLVVAVAITLLGCSSGPFDIGLFTLRQRRTNPAWFGRAFAISMSLNSFGNPVGSAVAGPLIVTSLNLALWVAVVVSAAAAVVPFLTIPAHDPLDR